MTKLSYRPPTSDDIVYIAERMRDADVLEVAASCGRPPLRALAESVEQSSVCAAILLDDVPAGIIGFAYEGGLGATAWMLGTDVLTSEARKMVVEGRRITDAWTHEVPVLHNFVSVDHTDSIRWLKAIGFTVDPTPRPYGEFGMPHYYFWKARHV